MECPESPKLSYAAIGKLDCVCPTEETINALIEHVRSCDACKHLLDYIRHDGRESFGTPDTAFFERLNDEFTPVPLPPSSASEKIPA